MLKFILIDVFLVFTSVALVYYSDFDRKKMFEYEKCRKKKIYKYKCDNYLCATAGICPYSIYYLEKEEEEYED